MFDAQQVFHVGVTVTDLDAAMRELADGSTLTWAEPREVRALPTWSPAVGSRTVPLRFVYSREGPQHVELLEGAPGTPWHAGDRPGLHHVGYWVDDLAGQVEAARGRGWSVELANLPPDDGYGIFAYVRPPGGMLVELVSEDIRPSFEEWWATG